MRFWWIGRGVYLLPFSVTMSYYILESLNEFIFKIALPCLTGEKSCQQLCYGSHAAWTTGVALWSYHRSRETFWFKNNFGALRCHCLCVCVCACVCLYDKHCEIVTDLAKPFDSRNVLRLFTSHMIGSPGIYVCYPGGVWLSLCLCLSLSFSIR